MYTNNIVYLFSFLCFTCFEICIHGQPVIHPKLLTRASNSNSNSNSNSKSVPPKVLKSIKRSAGIGAAVGSSVPAIKEIFSFPQEMNHVKSQFHSLSSEMNILNPSDYTESFQPRGEIWSYSKLMSDMDPNDIYGVSIQQDGKYALIIENTHSHEILPENIHYVTTIPIHISHLIDALLQSNIHFDIIQG